MLLTYYKPKNNLFYIYEKGKTYIARGFDQINADRMFKGIDNKPLTFPTEETAAQFCAHRNSIMINCF